MKNDGCGSEAKDDGQEVGRIGGFYMGREGTRRGQVTYGLRHEIDDMT